jgi:hypothetical protein
VGKINQGTLTDEVTNLKHVNYITAEFGRLEKRYQEKINLTPTLDEKKGGYPKDVPKVRGYRLHCSGNCIENSHPPFFEKTCEI